RVAVRARSRRNSARSLVGPHKHSAGADKSRVRLGALEVYDIANNSLTNAFSMGAVGLDWQVAGFGNFNSNPSETDMILRNVFTGGLEVYDISNNQLTGAPFIGTVGLDWQFAGIAPIHAPGASDLVLRNVNSGAFVGLDCQLGGFGGDAPARSIGGSRSCP